MTCRRAQRSCYVNVWLLALRLCELWNYALLGWWQLKIINAFTVGWLASTLFLDAGFAVTRAICFVRSVMCGGFNDFTLGRWQ